ncbi:hypothetical protein SAMN05216428_107109 [Nitrosospira sp. Nsp11]|nr:hypothetical protein SAMN05216428_107109 [Nitrosospira sp. Nsp11]
MTYRFCSTPLHATRKMCVVLQHHLAKGCVPPLLDTPAAGASSASSLVRQCNVVAVASPVRAFMPRHPDQPFADWMCANLVAAELRPRRLRLSPDPHRATPRVLATEPIHRLRLRPPSARSLWSKNLRFLIFSNFLQFSLDIFCGSAIVTPWKKIFLRFGRSLTS